MVHISNLNYPVSEETLRKNVPSLYATDKHQSRSDRYSFVNTAVVLEALKNRGFEVFSAGQSRSRLPDRREYTRHTVRLRHTDDQIRFINQDRLDVGIPEIVISNAHDGTAAFDIRAGWLERICRNGLMVSKEAWGYRKVAHSGGNIANRVIDATFEVVEGARKIAGIREDMLSRQMSLHECDLFGAAALKIKGGIAESSGNSSHVHLARHSGQYANNLWNVFNRCQENLMRGGLITHSAQRRSRTRALNSVDSISSLNSGLWDLAVEWLDSAA